MPSPSKQPFLKIDQLLLAPSVGQPLRIWSLIITIFGDCIVPRGGSLWLGSLTAMLAPLGIESGAVRTAMSRLTADGWLERIKHGRNAYYHFSAKAAETTEAAAVQIYGNRQKKQKWDGKIHLAIMRTGNFDINMPGIDREDRDGKRSELQREGFVPVTPSTFVSFIQPVAPDRLESQGIMVLTATAKSQSIEALCDAAFNLTHWKQAYDQFVTDFSPILEKLKPATKNSRLDPQTALMVRILTVHAYRRIVLRVPALPPELLPDGWSGLMAAKIMSEIYALTVTGSETWLNECGKDEKGILPPQTLDLPSRFAP